MDKYDVIVIGAGISGLSFAHYAAKSKLKVLILEKEQRVGGSFHSQEIENESEDFWIELGAHTCYNSYRNLIEVMEDCGFINQVIPRAKVPFRLLLDGQIKSFTSQINFFELLVSVPKIFSKKKEGETVASYYGSILGEKNFKRVFTALFSAVPSQKADDFPAEALFKKRERRKDILKNYTLKKGLAYITDAIARHHQFDIKYATDIGKIDRNQNGYKIKTNQGVFECTNLSICSSITSAPSLIEGFAPDIVDKLVNIKFQKIESYSVIVNKESLAVKPFAGLVPTNDDFFSVVSRDTVPNEKFRGFTFHFKPSILSAEQKLNKVCNVLGIAKDQVIEIHEKLNIVPSLRLGHYDLVEEIDQLLKSEKLFISGNYFAGLSIEDCVSRSKSEVERMVKGS